MEQIGLKWDGDLRFVGMSGAHATIVDGDGDAGPTPVAVLLESLGACTAIDVIEILRKGRQAVNALAVEVLADRNPEPPRYVRRIEMRFRIEGEVDAAKARRAVDLSIEKYCSVFNSLRDDVELSIDMAIVPTPRAVTDPASDRAGA